LWPAACDRLNYDIMSSLTNTGSLINLMYFKLISLTVWCKHDFFKTSGIKLISLTNILNSNGGTREKKLKKKMRFSSEWYACRAIKDK